MELLLYRRSYKDSVGAKYREEANIPPDSVPSSVRELYRSDFINCKESYKNNWQNFWGALDDAVGELVDTFDAEDNFSPGWESYSITEVVKDSLGTERNRVNLMLRVRDETKSYARIVNYGSDYDSTTQVAEQYKANFPKIRVVYASGVPILPEYKKAAPSIKGEIRIYSLNGKLLSIISEEQIHSGFIFSQDMLKEMGLPKGVYILKSSSFIERVLVQ